MENRSHIERQSVSCVHRSVRNREIFNFPFLASIDGKVSPYVVLLCNKFRASIKGDNLRVVGKHGTITPEWEEYVEENAAVITSDIRTINQFFRENEGLEVD